MGYCTGKVELDRLRAKLAAAGKTTDLEKIRRDEEALELERNPKPPALPDFDLMNRESVMDWAMSDDQEIAHQRQGDPIHVSTTWSRDRMLETIKKKLRERGDKRL